MGKKDQYWHFLGIFFWKMNFLDSCACNIDPVPAAHQVVGVQDARMGEEVCACIKLVDGQECTTEEIRDFCKGQVELTFPLLHKE